jgi:hypothetical protein
MIYSCAYFQTPAATLYQAQTAKYTSSPESWAWGGRGRFDFNVHQVLGVAPDAPVRVACH